MPMELYRQHFKPSRQSVDDRPLGSIGVSVTVAETEEEAKRISASRNLWVLHLLQNRAGPFRPVEEALAYSLSAEEQTMMRGIEQRSIVGTPAQVRGRLLRLGEEHGVDDFVILTITHDYADRVKSYRLLAEAFDL